MWCKKGSRLPEEKKDLHERAGVQMQNQTTSFVPAFLATLAAVLKKPQNLGFIFTWKLIPRLVQGKIGWQKGIKTEER